MKLLYLVVTIVFAGCVQTSGVVPISGDLYMISRSEKGYATTGSRVKTDALGEASAFCLNLNKKLEIVKTSQSDMVPFRSDAQAEIEFRCINDATPNLSDEVASRVQRFSVSQDLKSDIDDLPAAKYKANKKVHAIVIGIEKYRHALPPANFADHDAQTVSEYLIKVLGYQEENVIMLVNNHAGLGDFVKYFEKWLPNNVEQGGTVFIYYSDHGAPNPKTGDAYLVPYDGDPAFIDETGYALKRLFAALGKLPAKEVIVALDSCFSGTGGRSVLAKGARPIVFSIENPVLVNENMAVLSASAGDQVSSTYDEKGHGLFTYFMLKGIKNEDVVNEDGSLDISSLYAYIKPQVTNIARKKYNNEQTPQMIGEKNK